MLRFPNDAPIQSGNKSAEDHKDWLADLVEGLENAQFTLANVWGGVEGCIKFGTTYTNNLKAAATGTPSMTVTVSGGAAVISDNQVWIRDETELEFTAPTSNPRIDIIQVSMATRTISAKAGAEAAAPVAPDPDADAIALYQVYHRVGETSIKDADDSSNGYLTDGRVWLEAASGGGASNLAELGDVEISGLSDGQHLGYSSGSGKWGNVTPPVSAKAIILTAGGGRPMASNGCAAAARVAYPTNGNNRTVLEFSGGADQYAFWDNVLVPPNFSGSTLRVHAVVWSSAGGTTGTSKIAWKIRALARGHGDALDAALGSWATIEDTLDALNTQHYADKDASNNNVDVTPAGTPEAYDLLEVQLWRDVDGASSNNLTAAAYVHAVILTWS